MLCARKVPLFPVLKFLLQKQTFLLNQMFNFIYFFIYKCLPRMFFSILMNWEATKALKIFENIYLITGNLRIMKLMRHNINAVRERFSLQLKLAYKKIH